MSTIKQRIKPSLFFLFFLLVFFSHSDTFAREQKDIIQQALRSTVSIENKQVKLRDPYKASKDFFGSSDFGNSLFPREDISSSVFVGSGVLIEKKQNEYFVLTNYHVVEDSVTLWISIFTGEIFQATYLYGDKKRDLAIVSFRSNQEIPIAKFVSSSPVEIGDEVFAIGSPYGFPFTVTRGVISALDRSIEKINNVFIQTDTAINPGNSGGSIINSAGEVVGISTWIFTSNPLHGGGTIGINFAIDIHHALRIIDSLKQGKSVPESWLGLGIASIDVETLDNLGIRQRYAAFVGNIISSEPETVSKMRVGDAILAINGQRLHTRLTDNYSSIFPRISNMAVASTVSLVLIRDGQEQTVELQLTERPNDDTLRSLHPNVWPGYVAHPLKEHRKQLYGLQKTDFALLVEDVYTRSPASIASLKKNDLIVGFGTPSLNDHSSLSDHKNYLKQVNTALAENKELQLDILREQGKQERIILLPPLLPDKTTESPVPSLLGKKR